MSTNPYQPVESGHWYDQQGNPHHFRENGKATTLADARKHGWFPSVTKVIGDIMPKPALTNWKVNQGILAALTLPKKPDEPMEAFAARVVEDMEAEPEKAKDIGHALHAIMEQLLPTLGTQPIAVEGCPESALPFIPTLRQFVNVTVSKWHWSERVLVGPGFAGTCDTLCEIHPFGRRTLLDFKFRKKIGSYREDLIQLSAYWLALNSDMEDTSSRGHKIASVIVDKSNPKAMPKLVHWSEDEMNRGCRIWQLIWELWQELNEYRPLDRLAELQPAATPLRIAATT